MDEERIDKILTEHDIDKANLEAAISLGRRVADESGLCCEELGKVIWWFYEEISGGEEYGEEREK